MSSSPIRAGHPIVGLLVLHIAPFLADILGGRKDKSVVPIEYIQNVQEDIKKSFGGEQWIYAQGAVIMKL